MFYVIWSISHIISRWSDSENKLMHGSRVLVSLLHIERILKRERNVMSFSLFNQRVELIVAGVIITNLGSLHLGDLRPSDWDLIINSVILVVKK